MKKYYLLVGILLTAQLAFSAPASTNSAPSPTRNPPAKAGEDWTVNGKTLTNVTVTQVEPDRVHITYDGGVGTVQLADLPPDLQKRFNYSAGAAKVAIAQRDADAQKYATLDAKGVQQAAAKDWADVAQSHGSPIMGKILQSVRKDSSGNVAYLLSVWGADPNANGGYGPTGTNVLVVVGPGDHADGDMIGSNFTKWSNGILQPTDKWYYAGVYSYATVTGVTATVRIYTPDLEWAAKHLADQAASSGSGN